MVRIFSNEKTKLAYDGTPEVPSAEVQRDQKDRVGFVHPTIPGQGLPDGHPSGMRSVLSPGMNEVSDNEYALLSRDANFQAHVKAGWMVFMDDEGRPLSEPPPVPEYKPAPVNPGMAVVNQGAETLPPERTDAAALNGAVPPNNPVTGQTSGTGPAPVGTPRPVNSGPVIGPTPPLAPEVQREIDDYRALTADEQEAMYPALTPEARAVVDAQRSTAGAPGGAAPAPAAPAGTGPQPATGSPAPQPAPAGRTAAPASVGTGPKGQ